MAQNPRIGGTIFTGRTGGRVRTGSPAFHRRAAGKSAAQSMAEISRKYSKIIARMKDVTEDALLDILMPVYEKSQEYTPYKTGALRASGDLKVGTRNGKVVAVLKYGSPAAWYAAIVHERVDLNHMPPTRAKYLQSAMEEEMDTFLAGLAVYYATEMRE